MTCIRPHTSTHRAAAVLALLATAILWMGMPTALRAGDETKFDPDTARRITIDELKRRLDGGEKITFVDARGKTSGERVKGAVPVSDDDIAAWAKDRPKNEVIVTYCA